MRTPDFYRQRAADMRREAESMIDPELREQLEMVACEYDYIAKTAVRSSSQGDNFQCECWHCLEPSLTRGPL